MNILFIPLIFISFISSSLFIFLPLSKNVYDFYKDDMCYYQAGSSTSIYVNSCKKGEYCQTIDDNGYIIGTCQKYKADFVKVLDNKCSTDFECDDQLYCIQEKCSISSGSPAYYKNSNEDNYYYCPSDLVPLKSKTPTSVNVLYECKTNSKLSGKCYDNSEPNEEAYPDYSKVCGQIELDKISNPTTNRIYFRKNVKMNDIGEVKVKSFVQDEKACESGFALLFYGNEELKKLDKELDENMFLYCVIFKEAKKSENGCIIKYSLEGEDEYVYNTEKIPSQLKTFKEKINEQCEYLDIKIDNFKKYLEKMNGIKSECQQKEKIYSDPFTCGNDELREYLYFYKNPENSILYKDEEGVLNYLINRAYPLYGNNDVQESTQISSFLNIKFLFLY